MFTAIENFLIYCILHHDCFYVNDIFFVICQTEFLKLETTLLHLDISSSTYNISHNINTQ